MIRPVLLSKLLACALLLCARPAHADTARVVVAVSYFENTSKRADLDPLQKGFADMLITDLAVSDELTVVERGRLEQVLGELRLQEKPYFDRKTAARLGRGLGAAYLVTGAYLVSDKKLRLDVRILDVETGEVALAVSEDGALDAFFDIERQIAVKLLDGLGARLTLLQKKRVGSQSTRKLDAFQAHARALDAGDRGDGRAERAWLDKALAADPEFQKVKDRLAALEGRVTALEKSGGRILAPTQAHEHVHNARLDKAAGNYDAARRSLTEAARLRPELADVWLLAAEIDRAHGRDPGQARGQGLAVNTLVRDRALREVIEAYLRRDSTALHAALRARSARPGPPALHAAIFLASLAREQLPSKTIRPLAMAHDAITQLFAAQEAGQLAGALLDHADFLRDMRELSGKYLGADAVDRITRPMRADFSNHEKLFEWSNFWALDIAVFEPMAGPVTLRIDKQRAHPHWRDKPGPRRKDRLALWTSAPEAERIQQAAADPGSIVYRFDRGYEKQKGPLPGVTTFGTGIEVAPGKIRCQNDARSPTGVVCVVSLEVYKPSLAPGLYRVALQYRDADGQAIDLGDDAWTSEFTLIDHARVVAGSGISLYGGGERKVIFLSSEDARGLQARLLGRRKLEVAAEATIRSYHDEVDLYYDVDYSLRGGKPPAAGAREWMDYRDRIIRDGYHIEYDGSSEHVPLPALAKGRHWLCLVSVRKDRSRSAEAECHPLDIERTE